MHVTVQQSRNLSTSKNKWPIDAQDDEIGELTNLGRKGAAEQGARNISEWHTD